MPPSILSRGNLDEDNRIIFPESSRLSVDRKASVIASCTKLKRSNSDTGVSRWNLLWIDFYFWGFIPNPSRARFFNFNYIHPRLNYFCLVWLQYTMILCDWVVCKRMTAPPGPWPATWLRVSAAVLRLPGTTLASTTGLGQAAEPRSTQGPTVTY